MKITTKQKAEYIMERLEAVSYDIERGEDKEVEKQYLVALLNYIQWEIISTQSNLDKAQLLKNWKELSKK